jgi:hypothetical protein
MSSVYAEDSGDLLWHRELGDSSSFAYALCFAPDNSLVVLWGYSAVPRRLALSKFSPTGALLWEKRIVGDRYINWERPCMDVGADGSIALGMNMSQDVTFSFGAPDEVTVGRRFSGWGAELLVAQYSPSGVLQWVRREGGSSDVLCHDVGIAPDGAVFVVGQASRDAWFGADVVEYTVSLETFLAHYDSHGTLNWVYAGNYFSDLGIRSDGSCIVYRPYATVRVHPSGAETFLTENVGADNWHTCLAVVADDGFLLLPAHSWIGSSLGDSLGCDGSMIRRFDADGGQLWQRDIVVCDEAGAWGGGAADGSSAVVSYAEAPGDWPPYEQVMFANLTRIGADGSTLWKRSFALTAWDETFGFFRVRSALSSDGAVFAYSSPIRDRLDFYVWATLLSGTTATSLEGNTGFFIAAFSAKTFYTVAARPKGYGAVQVTPQKNGYELGESVVIRATPFFEGYEFSHWEGDLSEYTSSEVALTVEGNITARAVFVPGPNAPDVPTMGLAGLLALAAIFAGAGASVRRK